jgi:hypothetical protein
MDGLLRSSALRAGPIGSTTNNPDFRFVVKFGRHCSSVLVTL